MRIVALELIFVFFVFFVFFQSPMTSIVHDEFIANLSTSNCSATQQFPINWCNTGKREKEWHKIALVPMEGQFFNRIVVNQCFLHCLFFCFSSSSTGLSRDPCTVAKETFQWSNCEIRLDDELFHNAHRIDRNNIYRLLSEIMPSLKSKVCVSSFA